MEMQNMNDPKKAQRIYFNNFKLAFSATDAKISLSLENESVIEAYMTHQTLKFMQESINRAVEKIEKLIGEPLKTQKYIEDKIKNVK